MKNPEVEYENYIDRYGFLRQRPIIRLAQYHNPLDDDDDNYDDLWQGANGYGYERYEDALAVNIGQLITEAGEPRPRILEYLFAQMSVEQYEYLYQKLGEALGKE